MKKLIKILEIENLKNDKKKIHILKLFYEGNCYILFSYHIKEIMIHKYFLFTNINNFIYKFIFILY